LTVGVSMEHHPLAPRSTLFVGDYWYRLILTPGEAGTGRPQPVVPRKQEVG